MFVGQSKWTARLQIILRWYGVQTFMFAKTNYSEDYKGGSGLKPQEMFGFSLMPRSKDRQHFSFTYLTPYCPPCQGDKGSSLPDKGGLGWVLNPECMFDRLLACRNRDLGKKTDLSPGGGLRPDI